MSDQNWVNHAVWIPIAGQIFAVLLKEHVVEDSVDAKCMIEHILMTIICEEIDLYLYLILFMLFKLFIRTKKIV